LVSQILVVSSAHQERKSICLMEPLGAAFVAPFLFNKEKVNG